MGKELEIVKQFEGNKVEMIEKDGQVLFELYSTGMALGYVKAAKGKLYPQKDRIEKVLTNAEISTVVQGVQQYLTENMLYDFMLEARTEKCKSFRKWVTNEVLPTIRKTGGYVNEGKEEEFIDNYFPTLSEDTKKAMVKDLQKSVKELKPKADGYDRMINAKNNQTMNQVAKSLQVGRNKLFSFLRQQNILMKNNLPYQRFIAQGYFAVREFTKTIYGEDKNLTQTLVTAKGIDYIHNKLKQVNFEIE
ncbi:BRO family, N- domain protein [Clostridium botulinum C str. Eklund]|nr:BRO family, N- domain protein [Clostridium botulinum C str. Eklund]